MSHLAGEVGRGVSIFVFRVQASQDACAQEQSSGVALPKVETCAVWIWMEVVSEQNGQV